MAPPDKETIERLCSADEGYEKDDVLEVQSQNFYHLIATRQEQKANRMPCSGSEPSAVDDIVHLGHH